MGVPGVAVGNVAIGVADDENGQAQVGKRHKREQIDRAHVSLLKRRSGWLPAGDRGNIRCFGKHPAQQLQRNGIQRTAFLQPAGKGGHGRQAPQDRRVGFGLRRGRHEFEQQGQKIRQLVDGRFEPGLQVDFQQLRQRPAAVLAVAHEMVGEVQAGSRVHVENRRVMLLEFQQRLRFHQRHEMGQAFPCPGVAQPCRCFFHFGQGLQGLRVGVGQTQAQQFEQGSLFVRHRGYPQLPCSM